MDALRTGPRVRAPELRSGRWFGTGPLSLDALRGRFVLLDFWTSACANCLHVVPELQRLERQFADVLTVVGVHSPKFPHEAGDDALAAAIERAGITHAVLADPHHALWRQYAVRAWPTLVLVDPEGYVVAQVAGEGHGPRLAELIATMVASYEQRGVLRRGAGPAVQPVRTARRAAPAAALHLPAKAIVLPAARTGRPADTLLVADAGAHRLTELAPDATTVLRRIGTGRRGQTFAEPNGLALLPGEVAARVGYDLLVADTAAHVLRGVRLRDGAVTATLDLPALLSGARTVTGAVPGVLSPWDLAWWPSIARVVVAAAGVHLLLAVDPVSGTAGVLAGTTVEGLRDGPAPDGWLAQPSGLAVAGDHLWFVDAETSALRRLGADGVLRTAVGEGLFDFGDADGPAAAARLQHPLGVAVLPDGALGVADTFNGSVRRYDPATATVTTLARGLAEPSGLVVAGDRLLAVESAAHRVTWVTGAS